MRTNRDRRTIRRMLAIGTALSGSWLAAGPLRAVTLPTSGSVTAQTPGVTVTNPNASTLNVKVTGNAVIDWNGFNVPQGDSANFQDGRLLQFGNIAVLNRDLSGTMTTIAGSLTSSKTVSVWIYNPSGILIGSNATINTGSLVLTTLDPDRDQFLKGSGTASYHLSGSATGPGITVQKGASLTVSGADRGLIMVAPQINATGSFTAKNQDVAFITASDVTLAYATNSPLSVTIDKGTAIQNAQQIVGGTVSGRNVTFAVASQSTIVGTLLNVTADVTSATQGDRGIVLAAGNASAPGVTVTASDATSGVVGIDAGGALTTQASDADIVAAANGGINVTGALDSARDVTLTAAGGVAAVAGTVSATRDYSLVGQGVSLGGIQVAGRNLSVTAQDGTLAGVSGLTLQAATSSSSGTVTLKTAGTTGGDIALASGSRILGGKSGNADVRIGGENAANSIALGDVTARSLLGAVGTGSYGNALTTTGALILGDVTTSSALNLGGGTLTTGALVSDGAVTLASAGGLTLGGVDAGGAIKLSGTGGTTIKGGLTSTADIGIARGGALVVGGAVKATGNLSVDTSAAAGNVDFTGNVSAGRGLSVTSDGAQGYGGTLTVQNGLTIQATGALSVAGAIRAGGDISLGGAAITLSGVRSDEGALAISGSAGVGGHATLVARGDIAVDAGSGALDIASASSGTGAVTLQSSGALTAGTLSATGDIAVNGGASAVAITGEVAAGGGYAVSGGSVSLGSATSPVTQKAGGAVTINASTGGISGLGTLTLQSNADGSGSDALTLAITDPTSTAAIAFASGSTLLGGTSRQSDVFVQSGTADGLVSLGNVSARNLFGGLAGAAPAAGIARNGALTLGTVTVTGPLVLSGAAIDAGALTSSADAIALTAAGNLTATSITAAKGLSLLGSGATIVSGALRAGGDLTVDRGGAFSVAGLQAGGAVALGGASGLTKISVAGDASSGGRFTVSSTDTQSWHGISSGGALALTGAGITTGAIRSGGATALASTGAFSADSIDSGGAVSLTGTGATTVAGTIRTRSASSGDLSIDRDGLLTLGGIDAAGNVMIGGNLAPAGISVDGDASAGGAFQVRTAGAQLYGGGITAGGAVSLTATSGAIGVTRAIAAGGGVMLTGVDTTTVGGNISAGGAIGIAGAAATLRDVSTSQGDVALTATQALTVGVVDASGAANLTAGAGLHLTSVRGGAGVALAARGGDLGVDGAIDGGQGGVSAIATGTVTLPGAVSAYGDYQVSGTAVTLGGQQSVGGAVAIQATAGGVTGSSDLVLTANNRGSGTGGLALSATGGPITLAAGSVLNGGSDRQSDVILTSDDAGGMTLGDVHARTLSINGGQSLAGGLSAGNLSLVDSLTLTTDTAGLLLGDVSVTAGGVTLDSAGAVQTGDIQASGAVQMTGARLDFGGIGAGGVTLASTGTMAGSGAIAGGAIDSVGPVQISALSGDGTVTLDAIKTSGADGSLVLNAAGQVQLNGADVSGTADIATVTNPADILIRDGLTAGGTVHVTSTRDVRAPRIASTGGDLMISATNGNVTGYTPGSGIDLAAGPGHSYALDVGQAINLGTVVGGPVSLRADSITATLIDAGSSDVTLFADSGDLTIADYVKGGTVSLGSTGTTRIGGDITATGALTLFGDKGVSFKTITAPTVSIASSGGGLSGRTIVADGDATLSGSTIALDRLTAGGVATLTTQRGDLAVSGDVQGGAVMLVSADDLDIGGTISASGAATLTAAKDARFAAATGSGVSVTAGGTIAGRTVLAGGDAILQGTAVTLVGLDAGGNATLSATGGDVTLGTGTTGSDLLIGATGNAAVSGDVSAGDRYSVHAASLALGGDGITQQAGGQMLLVSTLGAVQAASGTTLIADAAGTAGDAMLIDSAGTIALGGTILDARSGNLGLRAGSGQAVTLGTVTSGLLGGIATAADGSLGVTSVFNHDAGVTAGTITAHDLGLALSAGDLKLGDVSATGTLDLATAQGSITTGAIHAGTLSVDAAGALKGSDYVATGGAGVAGGSIDLASVQAMGGDLLATSRTGDLALGNVSASGIATLRSAGALLLDQATAAGLSLQAGGDLGGLSGTGVRLVASSSDIGITAGGAVRLSGAQATMGGLTVAGNSITAGGTLSAAGAVTLTSASTLAMQDAEAGTGLALQSGGALSAGVLHAGGDAALTGGAVAITGLDAGGVASIGAQGRLAIAGDIGGASVRLTAAGDIDIGGTISASNDATLAGQGAVGVHGAQVGTLSMTGNSITAGGILSAAGAVTLTSASTLAMQDAEAGTGLALQSGGALNAGALRAGGDAVITGGGAVTVASLEATGGLTVTGTGDVALGSGSAGGAALIDAAGMATVGALNAGPTLTIRASDATITGAQSAATVAFENRNGDTSAMRLGDDAGGSGGFALSSAEIALVNADSLLFRQGAGDVDIGTLAFGADAGRTSVNVLGTGTMAITGTVSGSGSGRLFRFGGTDASDSATASAIWVHATSTGGGRLLFDGANLDLRGDRIAVGLDEGFLDALQDASADAVISGFVGNANSSLYNASLGGAVYDPSKPVTVSAASMTVHYGQYALFQNSGGAGTSSGVVLGGTPGAPVSPALTLDTLPGNNAFALFGTLNGISDSAASLLGGDVIALGNANLAATRINGCLAGSGSGCLAAVVIQPTLQVFQASQEDVFGSAQDLAVPFDPLVGGTNEELLTGLAALAPQACDGPPDCGVQAEGMKK